jgi:hypothetical protein
VRGHGGSGAGRVSEVAADKGVGCSVPGQSGPGFSVGGESPGAGYEDPAPGLTEVLLRSARLEWPTQKPLDPAGSVPLPDKRAVLVSRKVQHTAELGWSFAMGVARSPRVGADERRGCIAACGVFAKSNFRAPECPRSVKDEKAGHKGRPSCSGGTSSDPHGWPPSAPTRASAGSSTAEPAGIGASGL